MASPQVHYQSAITISRIVVNHVKFDCESYNPSCTSDLDFQLDTKISFNESNDRIFIVTFLAKFVNKKDKEPFELAVGLSAIFQTQTPILEEFKHSLFANVNAPAIAFPFLRSFITTLVGNAGFNPIIISSINFAATFAQSTAAQSATPAITPKASE